MSIKVITIDFWNTLLDSSNGNKRNKLRQELLIDHIREYGLDFDPQKYNDAMKASWEYFNKLWRDDYRTPPTYETVKFLWTHLGMPEEKEKINFVAQKFAESVLVYPPRPVPGSKEVVEKLSEDYKLGLVSDTGFSPGKVLMKLLEKYGFDRYFRAYSFSDETGVSKPHRIAFTTILDRFDCSPENAVHIGDIEQTDIAGAKKLGMKAIRFTGDPTGLFNKEHSGESIADAEVDSWQEIYEAIEAFK